MSRHRSKITSPLFKIDNGMNPSAPSKAKSEQPFFVKGKNDITYRREGGKDDIFHIKTNDGTYKLSRKDLKDALEDLKTQSNIPVKQLAENYSESFESILEALKFLYGSSELYQIIHEDIKNVFKDIKKIIPGTVAAFFVGCSSDEKFPGPIGCDPRCAASLPPGESIPGYSNCDDLVLAYMNGTFSALNNKKSPHAYIYIGDVDFNGFPIEHIDQLRKEKIENATLIFNHADSDKSYKEVSSVIHIDKLPQKQVILKQNLGQTENNTNSNDGTGAGAGVAIAIIIVIVIIILLIVLYQSTRK